ncbi:MAG: DUF2934 domain-containing protein [Nibricoccus sp.]
MKKTPTRDAASTAPTPESYAAPSQEEIARRAYDLWLQDGCPMGRSVYHWHEAERQLRQSEQNPNLNKGQPSSASTDERSIAALTDDSSPYNGLEKETPRSAKAPRDLAKRT